MNEENIKTISGGDKINLRTICKTDATIIPTATLWLAVNDEPEFKTEKAMINCIINIPFLAVFPNDTNFETMLLENLDAIFSYIMKYGVINHIVKQSPAMMEKKRVYISDQRDLLRD